jgi:hypothetical protein
MWVANDVCVAGHAFSKIADGIDFGASRHHVSARVQNCTCSGEMVLAERSARCDLDERRRPIREVQVSRSPENEVRVDFLLGC